MKRFSLLSISPLRKIALVVALHNAWFWVPIWVLYYRRFTNYGGVAFLEALSMGISMVMIIPGGICSDWIGRKRLLVLAGILGSIGAFGWHRVVVSVPYFFNIIAFIGRRIVSGLCPCTYL
jgi:MFS family permease